ncbi:preprotein translocase subunit SecG [Synergistes jonesii]|uniref:Protein-export membrane protein SecG n=1 Tax=Synergistes jonesii TaxID=2754 RepID=A0A073ISE0_9BACT|nr:preprotein translocase subunit SecG [Synergistes jonesii]KEJ92704.1 preprotein translocase subunit SecG [Synergistes jonesii]MDY2985499.1 preprotein translocase subunit SecG [Synergistes jonesii]OFB63605.1 preprotein translocase subunit SecG [Synergistes jonesii]OFB63889.1 preprotein translocase subunit SecG [Synergistes jonesii]OFB64420.1 preprotein translocase subunit SecG [Synergistes jonesii]
MIILFRIIHILVCAALIAVVMMQHRKSGGFTGSFGGGGTQADMGGTWQRMSGLTKVTAILIALFMILSIVQVIIR